MQKANPENLSRPKHADVQRDSMDDIREMQSTPEANNGSEMRYRDVNRDRALGEADRTGRHFDGEPQNEATEASKDHEAD
jgi:hypothetical protein